MVKIFFQEGAKRASQDFWSFALRRRWQTMSRADLRRYRAGVEANYEFNSLGFLQNQPVAVTEVYVPLQYIQNGRREDIYENIRAEGRTVVLGEAGAGKSMLLKSSLVKWAQDGQDYQRTPILVELFRFNSGEETLLDLLSSALQRSGVGKPERFLESALKAGLFSVFFDGLDEVVTQKRDVIVDRIERFAETFPLCQIVVTCRDAVYDGDLRPVLTHEVRIAGFDDAAIRRFWRLWLTRKDKATDVRERVEQMMASLKASPSLLRLARSPLLLTIIAALYDADPGIGAALTNSRAEFYETAVLHLLRRDADLGRQGPIASYKAGHKQIALRKIALHAQGAMAKGSDRRAIQESDLLRQIIDAMARFNLDGSHARPMLTEIVERSGLLVKVDEGNLLYEFPHLTLQEYLAAMELADDPARLLELYRESPPRWRETIKLWCGGANRDCTPVVAELYASADDADKLLALECIAEAREIDDQLATEIMAFFEAELGGAAPLRHLIINALGALAADPGPRGQGLSTRVRQLAVDEIGRGRVDAIDVLAASRVRSAIEILTDLSVTVPPAREALRSMGDLAVPVLTARAQQGSVDAVDDLAAVGTVSAAGELARVLWGDDEHVATRAAWRLAELMATNPDVEEELRNAPAPDAHPSAYLWLWEPFAPQLTSLRLTAGRIGRLIDETAEGEIPAELESLDPRIALPLALLRHNARTQDTDERKDLAMRIAEETRVRLTESHRAARESGTIVVARRSPYPEDNLRTLATTRSPQARLLAAEVFDGTTMTPVSRRLLDTLSTPLFVYVASFFWNGVFQGGESDWKRITEQSSDSPRTRRVLRGGSLGLLIVALSLGFLRTLAGTFGAWPVGPRWVAILGAAVVGLTVACFAGFGWASNENYRRVEDVSFNLTLGGTALAGLFCIYFSAMSLWQWAGVVGVAVVLPVIAVWVGAWWWLDDRHKRFTSNPFRVLLELDERIIASRATVIAAKPTEARSSRTG